MSRMSQRQRKQRDKKKIDNIPYINNLSGTRSRSALSYWDVIDDMIPLARQLPILQQQGGTCVLYSIQTAIQVATRSQVDKPSCPAKIVRDGTQMSQQLRRLGIRNTDDPRYMSKYKYNNPEIAQRYDLLIDIIKALENNNVVVAGGKPELAQDTPYLNTYVPVFNNLRARTLDHNICIIGCYQDVVLGACFITKMTNLRSDRIPQKYKQMNLSAKHLSYGILPIQLLQDPSVKLKLEEFATYSVQKLRF